ncbi:THAP domain-containing protein 1-like [Coccinella septempunctata]|uniref:THAP domain-containing protein 1-like n=1 Tax=Coccinella septempunctata TaxID=41139 RepID=UPI001D06FD18|nr:THAP domain-containing protein 1-like [Coccinella septempunctata]XP_044766870.1 THAP domain-containing protein 1-like [Coccinella septempunctata]XP_044766871.1 THAP domain-containing protein 1-like [Coccinella septempunctata]XP_044766874.1 THAP domain-containing protein 1-like [Coccinella septempunctata]XP_044766887.1 THAP domain-containing protein 1-like [Coccinella septempunctata]XP_044766893.1 THAP domain-containing protein 1-like [Coccinella septempunctata]XP_044766898.1 THAP domain-co
MSTVMCTYVGCSKKISTEKSITYFRFPVKDEERCRKWIQHSGNTELLDMDEKQLIYRKICEGHFEQNAFTNHLRQRLVKTAVAIH